MTCAKCQHFTLQGAEETAEQKAERARLAAIGMGQCLGFLVTPKIFTEWDQARCGLYRAARQMAAREKFITKMENLK